MFIYSHIYSFAAAFQIDTSGASVYSSLWSGSIFSLKASNYSRGLRAGPQPAERLGFFHMAEKRESDRHRTFPLLLLTANTWSFNYSILFTEAIKSIAHIINSTYQDGYISGT